MKRGRHFCVLTGTDVELFFLPTDIVVGEVGIYYTMTLPFEVVGALFVRTEERLGSFLAKVCVLELSSPQCW